MDVHSGNIFGHINLEPLSTRARAYANATEQVLSPAINILSADFNCTFCQLPKWHVFDICLPHTSHTHQITYLTPRTPLKGASED